jgi:CheY-like chemotaxis protein
VLSHNQAILVVDDEEAIRLSMRRFLEKVGYDVREAWSGRSALAQITGGRPPDLVLTDLRMRDGSGFWFLEELERDFPDLLRKTVILTGDPDHAEVKRLVARTGCPVVGKPVELPDLLELLDEVTRRD